ncbi:aminopeptidase P N-terminal domain-containing protein [Marinicella gelatinilytica]|uniref:aminopeptidase P N-terminal domain-containing protein n=1 Tax=Marinicella gelatinilytica TaxID=2996017 RepID=UPI002260B1DD|nr:aminopeptidase P N-terminal domain-containing protein [Marinicella gelatinilytica]MCX7544872.1 aminopeptidase P N-terminal domain-containing protein [Marinicella gelatinilytica]
MIKTEEFKKRRQQLMKRVGEDAVIILKSRDDMLRNGDAQYRYRQDSDFYYLTGFNEPDALLVLLTGDKSHSEILFCREKDPDKMIWDGPMVGTEDAMSAFGFDQAFDVKEADQRIPLLMQDRERLVFKLGEHEQFDHKISGWVRNIEQRKGQKSRAPEEFVSINPMLHDMRVYKSPAEIQCLKKSVDIAVKAHERMMRFCQPGLCEYDLQAEYMHELTRQQSEPSYLPIIGGGANACILHYINNNQQLKDGDLVLIDAGAEYDYYASDITRTFPVNGRFSARQRDLYEVVLQAQKDAIATVKPGNPWNQPHEAAVKTLSQGLLDLGILRGTLQQVLEEKLYRQYYMHMTGHWLGLDVHDCGDYQVDDLWIELEKDMVLTIEPALYIGPDSDAPEVWRGMGIRIEDDILVTAKGHQVLSSGIVKEIDDIEHIMRPLH